MLPEDYLKLPHTHHQYGCSKFNAWDKCIHFKSNPIDDNDLNNRANVGTLQHILVEQMLHGTVDDELITALTVQELEDCEWVCNWFKDKEINPSAEVEIKYIDDDFNELYTSTLDYVWEDTTGLFIADLKTGDERDYLPQLKGYALAVMQERGVTECNVMVIYSKLRKVVDYNLTYDECKDYVENLIKDAKDKSLKPSKCEYCVWCSKASNCPAVTGEVTKVVEGYSDMDLANFHSGEITDPKQMAMALQMVKVVEAWCKSVRYHAKEMIIKEGIPVEGTKVKSKRGKMDVTDIQEALNRTGYTADEFISACSVSIPKLAEIEKAKSGLSVAKSKKQLLDRLGDVVKVGKGSTYFEIQGVK